MINSKPRSIYIHIPFCNHLCNYCDFCKMQYIAKFADDYLIMLKKELESYKIGEVDTIYVGGGTPTSLNIEQLKTLLEMIKPYFRNGVEYTFETNVETLDISKLELLKKYGVNRLSVGVESTNDDILKSINRHHSFDDVKRTLDMCKEVGITNINLDLILGLPNSNIEILEKDLENLILLNPYHISTYSLIINPNTKFYIDGIKELDQDKARQEYDIVHDTLTKNGYVHYEVSNFAKPGFYSKHNFTYWDDKQYYGIGLGASGFIGNKRYTNTRSINNYLRGKTIDSFELVEPKDDLIYYLMLKLRTIKGINLKEFKEKFKTDILIKCNKTVSRCISNNLLVKTDDSLIPTYEGMMIMDQMVIDLINEFEE